jgi:hypothetical protein
MKGARAKLIDSLLKSDEPSIRWKTMVAVLGEDSQSRKAKELQEEIRRSPRVKALLAGRNERLVRDKYLYANWRGAHWTLAMLAAIGYPSGDEALMPMRNQVLDCWLGPSFYKEFESKTAVPKNRSAEGVPKIQGRYRRCCSQQGNALYSITKLGIADARSDNLAERLMHWQWADGGWNCDRRPSAHISSFNESLLPMMGLAAHAELCGGRGETIRAQGGRGFSLPAAVQEPHQRQGDFAALAQIQVSALLALRLAGRISSDGRVGSHQRSAMRRSARSAGAKRAARRRMGRRGSLLQGLKRH